MKKFQNILYIALGFMIAALTISLTSVGAQFSEGVNRVFITNKSKDPIPVFSRETLKIEGEVKIDGKPEVKLDGDTRIRIKSVDEPVRIRFDRDEALPQTEIFNSGKKYRITLAGDIPKICDLTRINGVWIYCQRMGREGEISGWINTVRISLVENFE